MEAASVQGKSLPVNGVQNADRVPLAERAAGPGAVAVERATPELDTRSHPIVAYDGGQGLVHFSHACRTLTNTNSFGSPPTSLSETSSREMTPG
jgi:hypothetical protein